MLEGLTLAFSSQLTEIDLSDISYQGDIPAWLSGDFISNGPAQFSVGETQFNHWLDGFAMLKKFSFEQGKVSFCNRFLHSQQYQESINKHKLYFNEFGTYADASWLMRIKHSLAACSSKILYDNCNVNISKIADDYIAMTETSQQRAFDLTNLQDLGAFQYDTIIPGQMSLAHPQLDIMTGDFINVTTEIGKDIQYHVFKVAKGSKQQSLIATYRSNYFFYMHSFSLTKNYVVLLKSPLKVNKFKLMFDCPFNHSLRWDKKQASSFIIINRHNGQIQEITTDPFICLHTVNAFERNQEIILDLICYYDVNPYDTLYLANLTSPTPKFPHINLRRYCLNLTNKKATSEIILDKQVEFSQINYAKVNGSSYQYAYMALLTDSKQLFFNAIQKIDMSTGKTSCWQKPGYYPGEPAFVAKPGSMIEDEGILLVICFKQQTATSSLVVLDAQSMQQMAEIPLPLHLPFGLHGAFISSL